MIDAKISNVNIDSACSSRVISDKNAELLQGKLAKIKNQGGCVSSLWNEIKTISNIGITDKQCNEVIEAYKKGEIDFEEADEKLKEYSQKQSDSLNLFSNIAASISALGATALAASAIAATGGIATPFVLAGVGAFAGAFVKSGFKFADRATNNIEGDALDTKQLIKDGLSGAITGSVATVTMGTASTAPTITSAVISCGKTGLKTGAVSSSGNYFIDCAFEDDKKFNAMDLAEITLEGTITGGTVGAVMGGANSFMHLKGLLNSGCSFKTFTQNAGKTSSSDVRANSVCTAEYKILDDRISDAA